MTSSLQFLNYHRTFHLPVLRKRDPAQSEQLNAFSLCNSIEKSAGATEAVSSSLFEAIKEIAGKKTCLPFCSTVLADPCPSDAVTESEWE